MPSPLPVADSAGNVFKHKAAASGKAATHLPGELAIWAFICSDLSVFTFYFVTFLYERAEDLEAFRTGSAALHLPIGVINTLVLLTSSLFVALAVQAARSGNGAKAQKLIVGAAMGGLAFVINKPIEWTEKVRAGLTPQRDDFFQLYYMMTGLHLLHVIVGMTVLFYLWKLCAQIKTMPSERQQRFLENGASYWHLVDLIWLVLFALFYLLK